MSAGTVLTAVCGRCGSPLSQRAQSCATCGSPRIPQRSEIVTADGSVAALTGAAPAAPRAQWIAFTIDIAPIVLAIAGTIAWALLGAPGTALVVGLAAIGALAGLHVTMLAARGRSLGRLILHLRTVDDLTGLPPRPLAALGVLVARRTGTATVDLRGGRDPLEPTVAAIGAGTLRNSIEGRAPAPLAASAPASTEAASAVAIVLDSGQRLVIERSLVIGRNPRSDGTHPVHVWPDLSRSIAKRHALLEWTGTELMVTDLDSERGTALIAPTGQRQELTAGRAAPARVGHRLQLGDRSIMVTEAVQR